VQDGELSISVRDDGMGIPGDMLPHIFDMFWQLEHALERAQGGLGIGLSLVRQLVDMHGGRVEAHSAGPGSGSEFVVRLALPSATLPELVPAPVRKAEAEDGEPAAHRILVVDDNRDSAESLALLLRLSGHDVRTAHDGVHAVDLAGEFGPEVVLLDIGLPGMNGYDAARGIRAHLGSEVTIVAMTGWGQAEDRRRSSEAGFDPHLVKPVDHDLLRRIIAGA
jgi:CheY-like chemotaxis protein